MMKNIEGIGSDIIEVKRIKQAIQRQKKAFIEKIFTKQEITYANKFKNSSIPYAGRFAAKEAIVKALGVGFNAKISWLDISISNDDIGKPIVTFSERVNKIFNHPKILLSISHCHEYAMAVAILVR